MGNIHIHNNKMTKLTKLFKNTDIKIAYKTNKNKLQNLNSSHNKDNTTTNLSLIHIQMCIRDSYKQEYCVDDRQREI